DLHLRHHDGQSRPLAGAADFGILRPRDRAARGVALALPRRAAPVGRDAAAADGWPRRSLPRPGARPLRRSPAEPAAGIRAFRLYRAPQRLRDLARQRRRHAAARPAGTSVGTGAGRCGAPRPRGDAGGPGGAMSGFVPPYPPRPAQPLSPLAVLAAARRNLLSVWEEAAYEQQL